MSTMVTKKCPFYLLFHSIIDICFINNVTSLVAGAFLKVRTGWGGGEVKKGVGHAISSHTCEWVMIFII